MLDFMGVNPKKIGIIINYFQSDFFKSFLGE
jgi:hypothetical protein